MKLLGNENRGLGETQHVQSCYWHDQRAPIYYLWQSGLKGDGVLNLQEEIGTKRAFTNCSEKLASHQDRIWVLQDVQVKRAQVPGSQFRQMSAAWEYSVLTAECWISPHQVDGFSYHRPTDTWIAKATNGETTRHSTVYKGKAALCS